MVSTTIIIFSQKIRFINAWYINTCNWQILGLIPKVTQFLHLDLYDESQTIMTTKVSTTEQLHALWIVTYIYKCIVPLKMVNLWNKIGQVFSKQKWKIQRPWAYVLIQWETKGKILWMIPHMYSRFRPLILFPLWILELCPVILFRILILELSPMWIYIDGNVIILWAQLVSFSLKM